MDVNYMIRRVEPEIQTLNPSKDAIKLESGESWTYGYLNEMSNRYANTLLQMGVQKGDRVGMLLYNSLEYFALYFAIARLGAIAVRINFRLVEEELEYILNDSGSTILCYDNKLSDRIADIKDNVPAVINHHTFSLKCA